MSGIFFLILRALMALALYAFLGWTLLVLWRDLRQQREVVATRRVASIGLQVQGGTPDQVYQFRQPDITIGRDPGCECKLGSEKVSASHARLSFHHNQWWVEDLNSTNGSFLNDLPVNEPTVVADGDQLRCGDVTLTVSLET